MKILWVKSDFLHPTTRGGQIRTLQIVKRLHARHEVHYIAYHDPAQPEGLSRAGEYCSRAYAVPLRVPPHASLQFVGQLAANAFSSMPLALSRYCSPAMQRQIRTVLKSVQFDIVVCDFLALAPNFEDLRDTVLFQHNVETMIWRRHAATAADPVRRFYFGIQARRMFDWEMRMCRSAARVIAVSPQDAAMMRELFQVQNVPAIPTGVDIEYFRRPLQVEPKADLVFLGAMDWMPNIDGVQYFIRDILPLIRKRLPACTLAVVGRSPAGSVRALAEGDPAIQVTGTVSDVRPWLWGSRVSVVPLRIGGGTRLKIYEAMASGTATVSTGIGAEGLEVTHPANIRLADSPSAFAEQCVSLLENASERQRQASEALELVARRFSWDAVVDEFERLLRAEAGARVSTAGVGTSVAG